MANVSAYCRGVFLLLLASFVAHQPQLAGMDGSDDDSSDAAELAPGHQGAQAMDEDEGDGESEGEEAVDDGFSSDDDDIEAGRVHGNLAVHGALAAVALGQQQWRGGQRNAIGDGDAMGDGLDEMIEESMGVRPASRRGAMGGGPRSDFCPAMRAYEAERSKLSTYAILAQNRLRLGWNDLGTFDRCKRASVNLLRHDWDAFISHEINASLKLTILQAIRADMDELAWMFGEGDPSDTSFKESNLQFYNGYESQTEALEGADTSFGSSRGWERTALDEVVERVQAWLEASLRYCFRFLDS